MSAGSRLAPAGLATSAVCGTVAGPVAAVDGKGEVAVDGVGPDAFMFGFAGFLPCSGAFGSQFLFFSASTASCSAVRCGTLLTKGTGTLVTYSATPSATARPTIRPTIRPITNPPR